jgi:hypothetical protein
MSPRATHYFGARVVEIGSAMLLQNNFDGLPPTLQLIQQAKVRDGDTEDDEGEGGGEMTCFVILTPNGLSVCARGFWRAFVA